MVIFSAHFSISHVFQSHIVFHNANGEVTPLRETFIMSVKVAFPIDHTDELKMGDLLLDTCCWFCGIHYISVYQFSVICVWSLTITLVIIVFYTSSVFDEFPQVSKNNWYINNFPSLMLKGHTH